MENVDAVRAWSIDMIEKSKSGHIYICRDVSPLRGINSEIFGGRVNNYSKFEIDDICNKAVGSIL